MPSQETETFEEVRARAAARRKIASQETRRSYLEDTMAFTLGRMAYNAEMKLRAALEDEFTKIINLSEEDLSKRFCDERDIGLNLPESSLPEGVQRCIKMLRDSNLDLLHEALNLDNYGAYILSDEASESMDLDSNYESDAKESWLLDNDGEDENLTILQQGHHNPPMHGCSSGGQGSNDSGIFPGEDAPRRSSRSRTSVVTYNQKKIFRNMVGTLEGPEYTDFSK
ncbi:hypothetical protein GGR51DRAFT_559216 [Nemania sp. FL0031]|nr:hypothetical protein GGR51DRAFT_559216 [Nemania sp. FL0031]